MEISAPLSERSRRVSESAGQASLAYASPGPTNVPTPENQPVDMPPVILAAASPTPAPFAPSVRSSAPNLRAAPSSRPGISGVVAAAPSRPPSSDRNVAVKKGTVRMQNAPISAPLLAAITSGASGALGASGAPSGPIAINHTDDDSRPRDANESGPHVALPSKERARSQTVVVRSRRASPIEKAFAFAAALVLICTIGAAAFWWHGEKARAHAAAPSTPTAPQPALQNVAQPAMQPVTQPALQPVAQPAMQPVTQPVTQPAPQRPIQPATPRP